MIFIIELSDILVARLKNTIDDFVKSERKRKKETGIKTPNPLFLSLVWLNDPKKKRMGEVDHKKRIILIKHELQVYQTLPIRIN